MNAGKGGYSSMMHREKPSRTVLKDEIIVVKKPPVIFFI